MNEIIVYTTESGHSPFKDYMRELRKKNKEVEVASIREYQKRLQEHGMTVNNVYPKTIRRLRGDIWELRPKGSRVIFFSFTGNQFVLLHAFKKQKQKAPPTEIERAENEMKDFIRRNGNGK